MKNKLLLLLLCVSCFAQAQQVGRIISLVPSITENIYAIGAQSKLVGCTSYCKQALQDSIQKVGSTINVNVEAVLALKPDLVITMGLTKPQDIATIEKLGIRVEIINTPKNFDEICEQTLYIGKLLGNEDEAKKLIESSKKRVQQIKTKAKQLAKSKVFFQIGANPIFTVLQNTFMNDYITICNGKNIAAGMSKGTMTRESVLMKNPDVIIIASMGGFGAEEQKIWSRYKGLLAVKKEKVFIIKSETSCSPTPDNFIRALEDVYTFISQ